MWANDLEEGVSNPLMTLSYINFEGLIINRNEKECTLCEISMAAVTHYHNVGLTTAWQGFVRLMTRDRADCSPFPCPVQCPLDAARSCTKFAISRELERN